jgi:hypothetical protein
MFSNPLARHRRNRRRLPEASAGLEDLIDLDEMLGALWRWGTGMPWVVELTASAQGTFGYRFVVDCPPLDCREPWFAITAYGAGLESGPEVLVVLPRAIADQGVAVGWAEHIAKIDEQCSVTAVALPTTPEELCGLQKLLEVAYVAAFDRAD